MPLSGLFLCATPRSGTPNTLFYLAQPPKLFSSILKDCGGFAFFFGTLGLCCFSHGFSVFSFRNGLMIFPFPGGAFYLFPFPPPPPPFGWLFFVEIAFR